MIRKITATTDGKYIGLQFDDSQPLVSPDGINFKPTNIQDLGNGVVRYSNSNYVALTKEVNND